MKKLIVAAAIVCAAVMSQAATYNWSAQADWVSTDGSEAIVGAVAYVFDANAYAYSTISAALEGGNKGVLDNALDNYTITEDGNFEMSGSGLTDDGKTPAYASMYALIVAKGNDGKDYFYQSATAPDVKITDGVISGGASFAYGEIQTGAVGSAGWTEVAPEPTSGLLLLIGVAGLALRRRRA